MTPFNLEQALAGKPFTNDKGWTVEDWHYFKGTVCSITVKWKHYNTIWHYEESELFMLPEKKKVWIVVYRHRDGKICSTMFYFKDEADEYANYMRDFNRATYLETIEKEYEL